MSRAPANLDPANLDRVIVHHSASPADDTTPETVRRWHIVDRQYEDVGYHFVIGADGGLHLGRPMWRIGAHDGGENATSLGICALGDWRIGEDGVLPGALQWETLVLLCADLLDQLDLPTSALRGHRENEPASTPTLCPGFDPAVLRDAVALERSSRRSRAPGLYPYTT